jgi:hypothetical protein
VTSDAHGRPSLWAMLDEAAAAFARWVEKNKELLEAFGVWASVAQECEQAHLYAPPHPEAWRAIAELNGSDDDLSRAPAERLILDLYGPGGVGHAQLRTELLEAPLLAEWRGPTAETLNALGQDHSYLAICGALPLVEWCLGKAAGKWQQPLKYDLHARMFEASPASPDDEVEMMLNWSAVDMLCHGVPEIWTGGASFGVETPLLRRNVVAHGLAQGWDTRDNAIRAVLLVAAAARVAGPLLGPVEESASSS